MPEIEGGTRIRETEGRETANEDRSETRDRGTAADGSDGSEDPHRDAEEKRRKPPRPRRVVAYSGMIVPHIRMDEGWEKP
ncbi:hypothetical protein NDU88_000545 [Pleurodeles waltl]|uniref:Uncharacterized protein n=1 Tax=Pleurodeles waltl TaxID=8319 RepID=A0AAV7TFE2_PLEWA|nr:hypothetical protein NDU88_000545 [Pleurodeles waltl]